MKTQNIRRMLVITTAVVFHFVLIFHLFFSPVIIIMASRHGIINASFVAYGIMFILSLFLGRAYCAWFCPGCGIQEVMNLVIRKKAKPSKLRYIKYGIFAIWLLVIVTGYVLNGVQGLDISYGFGNITVERKIILTLGATLIILPVTLIFGQFASCQYICWQAPFMIIGNMLRNVFHLPGLRLRADKEKCRQCHRCTTSCPMGIDVMKNVNTGCMNDNECILCGQCIDACPYHVIQYKLMKPPRPQRAHLADQKISSI